jgi:DNA repair exonuclease SbcCD ATPase subunit
MSKIIVDRVELKNFFSYGNSWTTVDFDAGVNLVLGLDKDKERSNGAGKTSFLEAIPFALFGQTGKGVPLPKIVNWRNGKNCEVRLHFQKDGIPYILHRGIKPGKLELTRDGILVPKLSDKRVFQQELETDLIGMDFKAAQALLFQNANNTISMFDTKKEDKRRFIERFFNLGIYSKAMEVANKKASGVDSRLSEIATEAVYGQRVIDDLNTKITSFVAPDLSVYTGNVVQLQVSYGTIIDNSPDIDENVSALHLESGELTVRRNELNKD